MTQSRGNPFILPIKQAGPDSQDILPHGLWIILSVVLGIMSLGLGVRISGVQISLFNLFTDLAFIFFREPTTLISLMGEPYSLRKIVFLSVPFLVFLFINHQLTEAIEKMARNLSTGDRFPSLFQARKTGYLFSFSLLSLIFLAGLAFAGLRLPTDTWTLILVRFLALGFLVTMLNFVLSGALGCALAEGHSGFTALKRMVILICRGKGHFLKAAVYTLPRWLCNSYLSLFILGVSALLPFLIAPALLQWWLGVAQYPLLSFLGIVRLVVTAAIVFIMLALASRIFRSQADGIWQGLTFFALVGVFWCLIVVPWKPQWLAVTDPWLDTASSFIDGSTKTLDSWKALVGVSLVALILTLNICTVLGLWLYLYPAAAGIAVFYSLRCEVEGKPYHSQIEGGTTSGLGRLSAPGASLFASGGRSSLGDKKPPRGWIGLTRVALHPVVLGSAILAVGVILIWLYYFWKPTTGAGWLEIPRFIGILTVLNVAVACVAAAAYNILTGEMPKISENSEFLYLPYYLMAPWGILALIIIAAVVLIGLVGSLSLVPWFGPVIWGLCYTFLLMLAGILVAFLIRWLPGSLILPVYVSVDFDSQDGVGSIFPKVDHYGNTVPWTFLGALAAGLPFALAPGLLLWGVCSLSGLVDFSSLLTLPDRLVVLLDAVFSSPAGKPSFRDVWSTIPETGICFLLFAGSITALTNAFLLVREAAGELPQKS